MLRGWFPRALFDYRAAATLGPKLGLEGGAFACAASQCVEDFTDNFSRDPFRHWADELDRKPPSLAPDP